MKNKGFIIAFALLVGFFFSSQAFGQESAEVATSNKVELAVTGMTCGGCANKEQAFLEGIDGVVAAKVDYSANKAVLTFDEEKTSKETILASLDDSPFPAKASCTAAKTSCSGKSSKKSCDPSQCHGKKKSEL